MGENVEKQLNSIEELLKILVVNSLSENVLTSITEIDVSKPDVGTEKKRSVVDFFSLVDSLRTENIIRTNDYSRDVMRYFTSLLFKIELYNGDKKIGYDGVYKDGKERVLIKIHDNLKKVTLPISDSDGRQFKMKKISDLILVLGRDSGMKPQNYSMVPYVFYSIPVEDILEKKSSIGKRLLKKYEPIHLLDEKFNKMDFSVK